MASRDLLKQFQGLTLDNVGTWPPAPRFALWLIIIIAFGVGGWFGLWSGQQEQLQQLQADEQKLKDEYKSKMQQAINLDELRKQREQVSQYVLTLEKQLPSKSEMDALLSDINQAGVGRGLDFELFKPGQTNVKEYYAELPIAIKLAGKYHDLGAFASDIANLPRIVTLNNLNLAAGKGGALTLDATAKTYRYLDADEVAAQRKAKQAGHEGAGQMTALNRPLRLVACVVTAATLGACGGGDEGELRTWMDDTRKAMRPTTQPVAEPKQFSPFTYEAKALIDPFDAQKMVLAVARQAQARASTSAIKPDLDRRREALEGFPLDQLKMVGTLRQQGNNVALIDASGQTFMVRSGNYLGQNFGLVTKISETEVELKEIVQDAAGEWVERPAKLELQEAAARQGSKR